MSRVINVVLILLMLGGAAVTYELKHRAEAAANTVSRLNLDIARERESIALLRAEWSLLSQPGRLQSVIERHADHFKLAPFAAAQVATLDEIPLRPRPPAVEPQPTTVAAATGAALE